MPTVSLYLGTLESQSPRERERAPLNFAPARKAMAATPASSAPYSSPRPPLPFGLGRDPVCPKHRCLAPEQPLPKPGSPLHDQVAAALAHLFQSFFNTSLRYLGCAEILDWLDSSGTVDAWILSGLEQGRRPDEIADDKNLEFGKEAFRQVVQNALEAEDEAWATSLRETAFSSSVSMVYEGVIAQVRFPPPFPRRSTHPNPQTDENL